MRQINYIIINPTDRPVSGLTSGFHYTVNSQGLVFNAIDIRKPGAFHRELNQCSIGIQFNGTLDTNLEPGTLNFEPRAALLELLVDLRSQFPNAKVLGASEYDRHQIKVSNDMNQLRFELSDKP